MTRLESLKRQARSAATWRGHQLGRFLPSWASHSFTAECLRCECSATVTPKPYANEIDVMGSAVALNCTDNPKADATARLIAAAPDLLAALRAIVDNHDSGAFRTVVCDDGPERPANYDAAREAIAKAEGR